MRLLQGWKVQFYTFVTLFLFIAGSLAALLWPNNPVVFVQNTLDKKNEILQQMKDTPKDVEGAQTVKDDSAERSTPQGQAAESPDQDTSKPDNKVQSGTTPKPTPNPNTIVKPIEPPIIAVPPHKPPSTCGICGQVSIIKGIMCPMTSGNSMSTQVCLDRL